MADKDEDEVVDLRDQSEGPDPPQQPPRPGRGQEEVIDLRDRPAPLRVVSGRPSDLQPNHRLVVITGGDEWVRAEAFVYGIYRSIGFCEESPRHRVEELARWAPNSRFHAVVDSDGEIIGTARTIFGRYSQLPVGKFRRTDFSHPDPVCELSSLTVRTDLRSTGVIEHLYRAGWLDALHARSYAVVALIDDWLLDVFVAAYHLPFVVIGEPKEHMGGRPIPVAMSLQGAAYAPMAESNPEFWRWTLEVISPEEAGEWDLPTRLGDGSEVVPGTGRRPGVER